jgi:tyrosine-protein phosphatase SIW14
MSIRVSLCPYLAAIGLLAPAFAAADIRGVPNFRAVNDRVYRGGQPSAEGFRNLAAMGIKTVVDLQEKSDRSHAEHKLVKSLGMHYVNIPMKGMHTPKDKQIERALKELHSGDPVFIHCKRGADRTGMVVACYRIEHDNWSREQALNEARANGMSWYQFPLQRYVLNYRPHSHGLASSFDVMTDSIRDKATGILDRIRN